MALKRETVTADKIVTKQLARVMDYKKVFSSEQGKRVLYDLMNEHFVMSPTNHRSSDPYEMAFNEGQRQVVLRIFAKIKTEPAMLERMLEEAHEYVTE